jgi:tetratricopeptide (TPR) repeat protein
LYRSLLAGRRVLVVLDNARDEEQVRPLLPGSAGCLAVVTSRRQLTGLAAVQGARLLNLDVLSDSESMELLAARLGSDRVAAEPAAAAQITALCARLPLALAIAAARAAARPGLRLAAVAAELQQAGQRLDALDTGDPAASVRAVFSWSHDNLSQPAAAMFRQLGLHPGPDISLPAAASLADVTPAAARVLIGELVSAHLLNQAAAGRFTFHDLLRAYASEQAAPPGNETGSDAIRRMLDHYLHSAYAADRVLNPGRTPIVLARCEPGANPEGFLSGQQALSWFEAERNVLRAVITLAAASGFDTHAWQLPWTLVQFFDWQGHLRDWLATQRTALSAARRAGDITGQAHTQWALGRACMVLGRFEDSHVHLSQALSLYTELGDSAGQADAHLALGNLSCRARNGDHLRHLQQALRLYRTHGQRYGQAHALNYIAHAHAARGKYREALTCCREALDLHSEIGNRFCQAAAWDTLGDLRQRLGSHAEAVACYQQALTLFRHTGSLYNQSVTFTSLGDSYQAMDEAEAAARAWREALHILAAMDHPRAVQVRSKLAQLSASRHE